VGDPNDPFWYVIITPNVEASSLTPDEYKSAYAKYYTEGTIYLKDKGYSLAGPKYKVVGSQEFAHRWW
jgi:hypothetical protein